MGTVKDLIAPETEVVITGDKGQDNWYRSSVNVELIGKDYPNGIGLQYTLYTLNNSNWNEYSNPLNFTEEGEYEITYQSFDKANNKEERKSVTFTIDKTLPEMELSYDLPEQRLSIKGIDNSSDPVVTKQKISSLKNNYIVSDKAGNNVTLQTSGPEMGKQIILSLDSLTYNMESPIVLNKHVLAINYADNRNQITLFNQYFQTQNDKKIDLFYIPKTNQTRIVRVDQKGEKITETKDGIHILKIKTNDGSFTYSTFEFPQP